MKSVLKESERVAITVLVDNYTDAFMRGSEEVKRPALRKSERMGKPTLAEHGLALLIEVVSNGNEHHILMDAGMTNISLFNNLEALELSLDSVEAIVLSHGHPDHNAALVKVIEYLPTKGVPLIVHPDAFLNRRLKLPDNKQIIMPRFEEAPLEDAGAVIVKNRDPYLLADGAMLVTGEIPRVTDFEKGFPPNYAEIDGEIRPDPLIRDDQAVVLKVKDKGLVVLSGCAHAGIINSVLYAKGLTGEERVHAVIGGFHLSGPLFEPLVDRTIDDLKKINPKVLVPTHCTGSNAMFTIRKEMPDAFVHNCVGTRYVF